METVGEYKSSFPFSADRHREQRGLSIVDNRASAKDQASLIGMIQRSPRNLLTLQAIQPSNPIVLQLGGKKDRSKKKKQLESKSNSKKSGVPSPKSGLKKKESTPKSSSSSSVPSLDKGEHRSVAWSLKGAANVGYACHHVINFNSCLRPWFETMVGVYMTYKDDENNRTYVDNLKGIMRAVGIKIEDNGSIKGGESQPDYVWRSANLFVGVKPEQRADDPGNGNEFDKTITGEGIKSHLEYGKKVYEKMKEIELNVSNTVTVEKNRGDLEGVIREVPVAYISDQRGEADNSDWKVASGNRWGEQNSKYELK